MYTRSECFQFGLGHHALFMPIMLPLHSKGDWRREQFHFLIHFISLFFLLLISVYCQLIQHDMHQRLIKNNTLLPNGLLLNFSPK